MQSLLTLGTISWRGLLSAVLLTSFSLAAVGRGRAQVTAAPNATSPVIFAHFAESPGSGTDLTLHAFFTAGLAGIVSSAGAQLDLYLFTGIGGVPLKSATNLDVCNPCSLAFTPAARSQTLSLETVMLTRGGFPAANNHNVEGYGILVLSGADPDNLAVQVTQKESAATYDLPLVPLADSGQYALAQVTEAPGRQADFLLYTAYTGGQAGQFSGAGATLDVYVLAANGQPLKSATHLDVCNPCSFALNNAGTRHLIFRLEDQIVAQGGFPGGLPASGFSGSAIVTVSGPDPLGLARLAVQRSPFATSYLPFASR